MDGRPPASELGAFTPLAAGMTGVLENEKTLSDHGSGDNIEADGDEDVDTEDVPGESSNRTLLTPCINDLQCSRY